MNGENNQPPASGGPASPNPPTGGGQDKIHPMSPDFMSGGTPAVPPPSNPGNPPAGGAVPPPPPPPPPAPGGPAPAGNVPPPPAREVDIRTMASDQESLRSSGGTGPRPKRVAPPAPMGPTPPGKDPRGVDSAKPGGNKRALFIGLGIVIFIGIAAVVARFLVFPYLLSDVEVVEEPPVVEDIPDVVTPTLPTFVHESFFSEPTDGSDEVNVDDVDALAVNDALSVIIDPNAEEGTFTEFYITEGSTADQVTSDEFLEGMLGALPAVSLEDDFTGFLYYQGTSQWPGYVFKLAEGSDDVDLLMDIFGEDLEASSNLDNFYLDNPGDRVAEEFSNGIAIDGGSQARYLAFEEDGASLNYGWKNDFVVISTSFDGFKVALEKLDDGEEDEPPVEMDDEPEESATSTLP